MLVDVFILWAMELPDDSDMVNSGIGLYEAIRVRSDFEFWTT